MPWINLLPPVCWSTISKSNLYDNRFVCLTKRKTTFLFDILMPHNMMILYFRLSYFHVSTIALFSTKYYSTLIWHRRSLDTFYMIYKHTKAQHICSLKPILKICSIMKHGEAKEPMKLKTQACMCSIQLGTIFTSLSRTVCGTSVSMINYLNPI